MSADLFWENVKKQIKAQNTTQEWLCNECGFILSSFRNRISLKRFPTVDEAYKIAQALNTTVEYLVTGKHTNNAEKIAQIKNLLLQVSENLDNM